MIFAALLCSRTVRPHLNRDIQSKEYRDYIQQCLDEAKQVFQPNNENYHQNVKYIFHSIEETQTTATRSPVIQPTPNNTDEIPGSGVTKLSYQIYIYMALILCTVIFFTYFIYKFFCKDKKPQIDYNEKMLDDDIENNIVEA